MYAHVLECDKKGKVSIRRRRNNVHHVCMCICIWMHMLWIHAMYVNTCVSCVCGLRLSPPFCRLGEKWFCAADRVAPACRAWQVLLVFCTSYPPSRAWWFSVSSVPVLLKAVLCLNQGAGSLQRWGGLPFTSGWWKHAGVFHTHRLVNSRPVPFPHHQGRRIAGAQPPSVLGQPVYQAAYCSAFSFFSCGHPVQGIILHGAGGTILPFIIHEYSLVSSWNQCGL